MTNGKHARRRNHAFSFEVYFLFREEKEMPTVRRKERWHFSRERVPTKCTIKRRGGEYYRYIYIYIYTEREENDGLRGRTASVN
jgi:hypothetical protein